MHKADQVRARLKGKIKDKPKGFLEGFKEKYKIDDLYNCLHTFVLMGMVNKVAEYIAHVKEYQAIYNTQNPTAQVDGLFLALTEPYQGENTDIVGREPLELAMSENNVAIIKLLLANANIANRPFKTKLGITDVPIVIAIGTAIQSFAQSPEQSSDCLPMIDAILEYQADPNTIDVSNHLSILGVCISHNFLAGAERLIAKGAQLLEITYGKNKGETLFSMAVKHTQFPMICLLAKSFAQQIKSEIDICKVTHKINSNDHGIFFPAVSEKIQVKGPIDIKAIQIAKSSQKSLVIMQYSYMKLLVERLPLSELLAIFKILQIDFKQHPSCLFWSVAHNDSEKYNYFLKEGVDPFYTMPTNSGVDGYNLLMAACMANVIPPMAVLTAKHRELLYQRVPIGHYKGLIALNFAILNNNILAMQFLVRQKYELSHLCSQTTYYSVLHDVVMRVVHGGNVKSFVPIFELMKTLLDIPENKSKVNLLSALALHAAMLYKLDEIVDLLLVYISDVNVTYQYDNTTYQLILPAIQSNKIGYLKQMCEKGLILNEPIASRNYLPIMAILSKKCHILLDFLLQNGMDAKLVNPSDGNYPLELAFIMGDIKSASLLLDRGAELNKEYKSLKTTPLTYLLSTDHSKYIKELLQRGADPYYVNKEGDYVGLSALQIAVANSNDNPEILVPFLEHFNIKKEIIEEFKQGSSIVYAALKYNDQLLLGDLLKNGVKLNQPNRDGIHKGDLSLALAIRNKDKALIKKLLAAGATADGEIILDDQTTLSCKDLAIQLADTDILAMLNIQISVPLSIEVQERQLETSDVTSTIFASVSVELSQINPEVYYSHSYNFTNSNVFLHHAKWEVEQLSAHLSKIRFLNNEFKKRQCLFLLAIDVLRIFEALMKYSITEHNESIVTVKLASEIRNIIMHVFFKLNIEDTVSFAKLCIDQLLPVIELYMQGKVGNIIDLGTMLQECDLYIKLLPLLLSNAERTLSHEDLVKLIVESLQFLMKNSENIDDKIAFRAAPRTVRISCMALTIIGQYHRLLKEDNANIDELFKGYFTDKNELAGFLSFLNRCTYLRGMVGHEFNQETLKVNNMLAVDTVGELSLFKMLLSVKRYHRNFELGSKRILNSTAVNLARK